MNRPCEHCGHELIRPKRINSQKWLGRRFCDNACARAAKHEGSAKICTHCGGSYHAQGTRQRFCSLRCSSRARGTPRYRKIGEKLEHRAVMERVLGRPLATHETVHHKNGRRLENVEGNLELWVKPQPAGQRLGDLLDWMVENYRDDLATRLAESGSAGATRIVRMMGSEK